MQPDAGDLGAAPHARRSIAIIGSGIAGLVCAHRLAPFHDVTLFERDHRPGGHTRTIDVEHEGRRLAVDTGFIVYNERNYPGLTALLDELGVGSRPTSMSFGVRCERTGFEYGGTGIGGLLARPSNALSPRLWAIVRGVRRLATVASGDVRNGSIDQRESLGRYVRTRGFSTSFVRDYLVPMASAIWSSSDRSVLEMPAITFLKFYDNHGMLDLRQRPTWRFIPGGSRRYVQAILDQFRGRLVLGAQVAAVLRHASHVEVRLRGRGDGGPAVERFDAIILACHSDQALALLGDASDSERSVLGAIRYQPNDAAVHSDARLLQRSRRAWSSWNTTLTDRPQSPVSVTYNMSMLQCLGTRTPLCVTLNQTERIDPRAILDRCTFHHPVLSSDAVRAQSSWATISGRNRTHFAGAYWGYGFHEDGLQSALRVCRAIGVPAEGSLDRLPAQKDEAGLDPGRDWSHMVQACSP